jgi:formylmethanofuran dehydrogenase subunit B
VILDPPDTDSVISGDVRFRTALPGIHLSGTAYRMDGIPVPLRPVLAGLYPSDEQVLLDIRNRIKTLPTA